MCAECERINELYRTTNEHLMSIQRQLAHYDAGQHANFVPLWNECLDALRALWRLREEMAAHVSTHGSDSMSSHG